MVFIKILLLFSLFSQRDTVYIHIFANRDSCQYRTLREVISANQRVKIAIDPKGDEDIEKDMEAALKAVNACMDSIDTLHLKLGQQREALEEGSIDLVFRTAKLREADFPFSDSTYVKLIQIDSATARKMKNDYHPDTIPVEYSYNTQGPVWTAVTYVTTLLTEAEARRRITEDTMREKRANDKIAELQPEVDSLRMIVAELDSKIAESEAKLAECRKKPKYYGKYIVKPGESLSMIAGYRTIYNDPTKWDIIYKTNEDLIKDPKRIQPGWVLLIPGLDAYKVIPGDCLWRIASYISVYGKVMKWTELYEANKDKIKDKDLIYPGQEFTIPR